MYTIPKGIGQEGPVAVWGQAGHWSTGSKELYCASFVFLEFYFSFITVSVLIVIINIVKIIITF